MYGIIFSGSQVRESIQEMADTEENSLSNRKGEFKVLMEGLVTHVLRTKRTDYYACAAEYFSDLLRKREEMRGKMTRV